MNGGMWLGHVAPEMVMLRGRSEELTTYGCRHRVREVERVRVLAHTQRDDRAKAAEEQAKHRPGTPRWNELAQRQDAIVRFLLEDDTLTLAKNTIHAAEGLQSHKKIESGSGSGSGSGTKASIVDPVLREVLGMVCDPAGPPDRSLMLVLHMLTLIEHNDSYFRYIYDHCPDRPFMLRFRSYTLYRVREAVCRDVDGKDDMRTALELATRYTTRNVPSGVVIAKLNNEQIRM